MSKIRYLFMVVTCMVFNWVGVAQATNLIINPGNESPLVNGEIPGWTEIVDNSWTQASSNPAPFEGQFYFFAGSGALAELAQVVDVTK